MEYSGIRNKRTLPYHGMHSKICFCLQRHFVFDGDYYNQIDGIANVGSRPSIWFRFVDGTFALFDNVASATRSLQYLNARPPSKNQLHN